MWCTKPSSRPILDQNLCEHSGSIVLGRLQNKLEGTIAMGLLAYFRGEGPPVMITMGTNPWKVFWMSFKWQDPLEAILVIFGRRALIFLFESSWKIWKMTPLLCACAVVITLETQKCRKRAPRSVEFNFFINCDRHKRFSQNEKRRADLQNVAADF